MKKLDPHELMAKCILSRYVDKSFENLMVSDRPDLQSDEMDLGIEVTRGISSDLGQMDSILADARISDGLTTDQLRRLDNIGSFIQTRKTSNGLIHGAIMPHDGDLGVTMSIIENAIVKKNIKLLSGGYKKFNSYHLFIYIESIIVELENIIPIVKRLSWNNYSKIYFFLENRDMVIYTNQKGFELIKRENKYELAKTDYHRLIQNVNEGSK